MVAKTIPFIGKEVLVKDSSNTSYVDVQGVIVDETKNTFILTVDGEKKTILKKDSTFLIEGKVIDGNKITKRIEDRIKS